LKNVITVQVPLGTFFNLNYLLQSEVLTSPQETE
jgi:hypothetical protein